MRKSCSDGVRMHCSDGVMFFPLKCGFSYWCSLALNDCYVVMAFLVLLRSLIVA